MILLLLCGKKRLFRVDSILYTKKKHLKNITNQFLFMNPEENSDEEKHRNYHELKIKLETALDKVAKTNDLREAKGYLIEVQSNFKGLKLQSEDREELYHKLQKAFEKINDQIEEEHRNFENESFINYLNLKAKVDEAVLMSGNPENFKETWDFLIEVQSLFKGTRLLREHREEIYMLLQEAFDNMKTLREKEQSAFEKEAFTNYDRLKALVEKGFCQAVETNQYKETREFLKKIQSEFKGTRLTREQREELYSRLQTAFDILGKRLDEFFRQKKKNWEVKMQYKLTEYLTDIFDLEESLKKDHSYLKDLEDQLDIAESGGKGNIATTGLKSRITSTRETIDRKEQQIRELESELKHLKDRLEQGE